MHGALYFQLQLTNKPIGHGGPINAHREYKIQKYIKMYGMYTGTYYMNVR